MYNEDVENIVKLGSTGTAENLFSTVPNVGGETASFNFVLELEQSAQNL